MHKAPVFHPGIEKSLNSQGFGFLGGKGHVLEILLFLLSVVS